MINTIETQRPSTRLVLVPGSLVFHIVGYEPLQRVAPCLEKTSWALLRQRILTIIAMCSIAWLASIWLAAAIAQAQELPCSDSNLNTAEPAIGRLFIEKARAPHLLISMTDHTDFEPAGSLRTSPVRIAGDEATNPSAGNTITRQGGPAASANRTEKIQSGPLVLSSFFDPTASPGLTNFRAEPIGARQTIQRSPDLAGAKVYRLLDDRSAPGSFLHGYQANYLPSEQWLANYESFAHEVVQAPRPLFELDFGSWRFPVMLSGAAVS